MNIIFNEQKLKISDRLKQKIQLKFDNALEKLLKNYEKDLKVASLSIEKIARTGYQIKFDMNLPACPINIKENSRLLLPGIIKVKDIARRQIKKNNERLREY